MWLRNGKFPLSGPYFFWQTTTFPNCPSPIVTLRMNFSQICDVPFVTGTTWAFSEFISIGITMISVCLYWLTHQAIFPKLFFRFFFCLALLLFLHSREQKKVAKMKSDLCGKWASTSWNARFLFYWPPGRTEQQTRRKHTPNPVCLFCLKLGRQSLIRN